MLTHGGSVLTPNRDRQESVGTAMREHADWFASILSEVRASR
jgi:hypothetical protein